MIQLVTDSSAYLKKDETATFGITMVPMSYTVNGKSFHESYVDCNGDFESLLRTNGSFTTSQPNLSSFLSCFQEALDQGNKVLCLTISSRLSGAYATAYAAAKQTGSPDVAVFDSRLTAGGLFMLVEEAKKLIDQGMEMQEILRRLPAIREKITITFSVDDMNPLRNSGRIGFVRMSVGTILNIKPILQCVDGAIVHDSIARGNRELLKKLMQKMPENPAEIIINHIGMNPFSSELYHLLCKTFPTVPTTLRRIGPVLGIHLGVDGIGVVVREA